MSTKAFEVLGRSVAFGWLLVASSVAGCGGSQEPAAPATRAEAAPAPSAPAKAPAETKEPVPAVNPSVAGAPSHTASAPQPAPAPEKPAAASTPKPPQIALWDLLTQRDLWPAKVALTRPLTIERGVTLPVGHELPLYEFNGSDIVLDGGEDVFECPADYTDVIERASATKAKLSPEQLALTDKTLVGRPELWPLRVAMTRRVQFQNGNQIPVGHEVTVRFVGTGGVNLYDHELADHFQAEIFETDVIARARARLTLPEAEREPFFVRAVAAALEPSSTASDPELENADYVLVYRSRLGCPRCAAFAPELAQFYERVKREHPRFEAVFYSDDKTAEDARTVFAKEKLPGRAIRFDQRIATARLSEQPGRLLPLVYLYDAAGNLIKQNHPDGGNPSATDVLALLEAKLAEAR